MPPRKKAKNGDIIASKARQTVAGRRGDLKGMPHMPLDIFLETFSYLCPSDLLSLARTSKSFRAFLMKRTFESLWEDALRRVEGLPECPPHLSVPAYVNLVFSPHCHNCLKPNIRTVLWEFAVRYCTDCRNFLTTDIPHMYVDSNVMVQYYLTGLIHSAPVGRYRRICHVPEYENLDATYKQYIKTNDGAGWKGYSARRRAAVEQTRKHADRCRARAEYMASLRALDRSDQELTRDHCLRRSALARRDPKLDGAVG